MEIEKKKVDYKAQGKKNRASGARFELKVRALLEGENWTLVKWSNNIDFEKDKIVPAKRKYNPFSKALTIGTGFPDFIGFRLIERNYNAYDLIGIEVKKNGYLDKEEKKRAVWYLKNNVFTKIYIAKAKKIGNKIDVELINFADKYPKLLIQEKV